MPWGPSANKSGKASGRYFDVIKLHALLGVDSTILDLSVLPARFSDKENYKRRPIDSTRVDRVNKWPQRPYESIQSDYMRAIESPLDLKGDPMIFDKDDFKKLKMLN